MLKAVYGDREITIKRSILDESPNSISLEGTAYELMNLLGNSYGTKSFVLVHEDGRKLLGCRISRTDRDTHIIYLRSE